MGDRERSQELGEVFSDNFSGDRGSPVDRQKWSPATDGETDGELQSYTDSTRNARLDGDGNLVITARAERRGFTSAKLRTESTFTGESGRAEARIKVPDSQGVLSAFRVLGADELAVMENVGSASAKVTGGIGAQEQTLEAEKPFSDDFHIYAVDWQPGLVVWSVDGKEFFRVAGQEAFNEPFSLVLDLAVNERPRNLNRFPQRMIVDFVKVSVAEEAPPASEEPTTPPSEEPTTEPTTPPTTKPTPEPTTPPAAEEWKEFTLYLAGQRVQFDGITYEVLAPHTSLPGWEPPAVKLLFKPL